MDDLNYKYEPILRDVTVSYSAFYGHSFEEFIHQAKVLGYGGVQFTPDQRPNLLQQLTPDRTEALRLLAESNDLRTSVHNIFYDINLVSVVPEVREFSLMMTGKVFSFANSIGARKVTVHPGYMFSGWRSSDFQRESFWEAASAGMKALSDLADCHDIDACLENGSYYLSSKTSKSRQPLHIGITGEEMEKLLEPCGNRVKICLDLGKLAASEITPVEFLENKLDCVGQIQISGINSYNIALGIKKNNPEAEIVIEGSIKAIKSFVDASR